MLNNHESWYTCPNCGEVFDRIIYCIYCPNCGHNINNKNETNRKN